MDPADFRFQPDLARASTIPAHWYTAPEMLETERSRVFGNGCCRDAPPGTPAEPHKASCSRSMVCPR
jgi:hypothetical protein